MKGFSQLVALVCATTAALVSSPVVSGAGMSTHSMVGRRAEFWFSSSAYPEYKEILQTHRNWWQPGTFFPDWGYACGYDTEAEAAHWPPFLNFTANWVRDNYPRPWSADAENTIAFLFGMMAHSVADNSWHSLSMNEGLIEIMQHTEFHGSFGDAHSKADTGGEFVLKFTTDLQGNAELRWNIPSDDLFTAYQLYFPSTQVTPQVMERCLLLGFAGIWANQIAGDLALPYVRNTPLLNEEYESYFLGGLNDMAAWTSRCYEDLAKWLEVGGHNRPMCTLMDNQWGRETLSLNGPSVEDTELLSGEKALEYLENFGFKVASQHNGKHLSFELQRRDGSDPQPLLDQLAEEIDNAMLQALKKEEEMAGVIEEVEATCVKENQFRNSSTISYNLGNSYSGLGSALVTGDFNGDGIDDLAMGAPSFGGPGEPMVGVVYVLYGKRGMKPSVSLLQGIDQVASVTLRGDRPYSRFGDSLTVVDLNGDGIDDLAIAAPTYNGLDMYYDGRVYVHFGSGSGLQSSASVTITTEQPFPIPVEGTHAFKFVLLGSALSSGDADGDGFADLLVGSPQAAPHAQGHQRGLVSVFLSSSRHVGTLDVYQAADIEIFGGEDYQRFGSHVEVAALPSGQRLLLVGSNYFTDSDVQALGRLYGYDLKDTSSPLFTITGSDELQKFGAPFLVADFFGDNRTMVAVSAISEQVGLQWQAGALRIFDLEGLEGDLEFRRVDFETTIQGNEKNGHFSWGLASGSSSLWVSEPYFGNFRAEEKASTGRIYEYKFGGAFPTGVVRDRAAEADSCVTGKEVRGQFGRVVVALDLDADGQEDLAVSSFHSSSGSAHSGLVSVFFG